MNDLLTVPSPAAFYKRGVYWIAGISSILLITTSLFIHNNWDLRLASWFYVGEEQGWLLVEPPFWKWLYEYGTIPSLILTLSLIVLFFLSYLKEHWLSWRPYLLVMILTSIIGGGVIVNAVLKDYWGRPRPRQVQEFNGSWTFHHPSQPGISGKGKSFPCGHCTAGYMFVTSIFLYRKSRILALSGTIFGLIYGTLISIARTGQGAHFVTDAIWALGIILLTGCLFYYFILQAPLRPVKKELAVPSRKLKGIRLFLLLMLIATIITLFLTRRPIYHEYRSFLKLSSSLNLLRIHTNLDKEIIKIRYAPQEFGTLQTIVQGFGWPSATHKITVKRHVEEQTLSLDYQVLPIGYYAERNLKVMLTVPDAVRDRLQIEFVKDPAEEK